MTNYEVLKIHGSQMALSQLQLLLTRLGTRPTPDRPPLIVYPGHGGLHSGGLWDGGDRSTLWLLPCPWSFRWFLHLSAACCSRLLRGRPSFVLRRSWGPGRPGLEGGGGGRGRRSRCQEPASLVSVSCGPGRSGLSGSVGPGRSQAVQLSGAGGLAVRPRGKRCCAGSGGTVGGQPEPAPGLCALAPESGSLVPERCFLDILQCCYNSSLVYLSLYAGGQAIVSSHF